MTRLPALALAAAPGRRQRALDIAREADRRGFAGLYCASFGDNLGLCVSLAHVTERIQFGTGIANIYVRHPFEMAAAAAYLHEVSGGRFRLGLGVSHGPTHQRYGIQAGKPVADMRQYVERMRSVGEQFGPQPPLVLAALRKRMTRLAGELADGAMWANAALSHMPESLAEIPAEKLAAGFFVGNMLPVCIDDDRRAAETAIRRYLTGYLMLPNYRNYWKEAGYVEEMEAIERALAAGDTGKVPEIPSERWLRDVALFGSAKEVRDGLEAWYAAGVNTPILVPNSTRGGQQQAFDEVFAAFA